MFGERRELKLLQERDQLLAIEKTLTDAGALEGVRKRLRYVERRIPFIREKTIKKYNKLKRR